MVATLRPNAFQELFRTHFDYVWRVALREVGQAYADDVTQDAFVIAHRRFPRFDGVNEKAWLHAIVRNVAHNHRRAEGRRTRRGLRAVPAEPSEASVEDLVEVERAARVMETFLASLPQAQAEAFLLAKIEGLTASEIAQIQAAPRRTVLSRVRLAQDRFKRFVRRRAQGVARDG